MYYKAKLNREIVDALDYLRCVRYYPNVDRILALSEKDKNILPQGIISSSGQYIWQASVEGAEDQWEAFPDAAEGMYAGTVVLTEIGFDEYSAIRSLLDEGNTPIDPEPEPDPEPDTDEETLAWAKKKKIEHSFVAFKNPFWTNLLVIIIEIILSAGIIFTCVQPILDGDFETAFWTIAGPVFFGLVAFIFYQVSSKKHKMK